HADLISVSAETSEHDHTLADESAIDINTDSIDRSGRFVTDYARRLGRIGVESLARHQFGEVHPARRGANAHLAGNRNPIGRFANLQNLGSAVSANPDCTHRAPLPDGAETKVRVS